MSYWFTTNSNNGDYITGGTSNINGLTWDVSDAYTPTTNIDCSTTTLYYEPLREWLPNSCKHKKYFPSWHLVRSYK